MRVQATKSGRAKSRPEVLAISSTGAVVKVKQSVLFSFLMGNYIWLPSAKNFEKTDGPHIIINQSMNRREKKKSEKKTQTSSFEL